MSNKAILPYNLRVEIWNMIDKDNNISIKEIIEKTDD